MVRFHVRRLFCETLLGIGLILGCCCPSWAQQKTLDLTTFVVIGEGLSAGLADFGLRSLYQTNSFPALVAGKMGAMFPQPLIQAPGLQAVDGFGSLPVRLPQALQTTVRSSPTSLFVFNLSVPGFKLSDSLNRRPALPLVNQRDSLQTAANMILGFPALLLKDVPRWTQVEYAQQMFPTFVVVALGYSDVLGGVLQGNPTLIPTAVNFRSDYNKILTALNQTFTGILVVNIPDPTDTAFFSSLDGATRLVGASPDILRALYGLRADDYLTPSGLTEIGNQLLGRKISALPAGSVVSSATVADIRARVAAINSEISSAAQSSGAVLYDLRSFFNKIRTAGAVVGTKTITSDYLGGFYSLSGLFPGLAGHGLIANDMLDFMNRTYGKSFKSVDVSALLVSDTAYVQYEPSRQYTLEELKEFVPNMQELMNALEPRQNPPPDPSPLPQGGIR